MRQLSAAPQQDFVIYVARPDTLWALREPGEPLAPLYSQGYLPYSGAKEVHNVFYSARSARVVLKDFSLTSENRRIAKKFDGQFSKARVPATDFTADESFYTFCLSYFAAKHGEHAMPRERLEFIMRSGLVTTVAVYTKDNTPVAYVLEVVDSSMGHYWFSFYDLAYARQSLGMWLMLDSTRDAKAAGLAYYYLGTVYGQHALYKTNFEPLEWWNGTVWSSNLQLLKEVCKSE